MGSVGLAPNMKKQSLRSSQTAGLYARAQATGTVAYFCLEYAIEDKLPIYAGGLGILAGDLILEAGKLGLDFTGIGLFYNHGFSENQPLDPATAGFKLEPIIIPVEVGNGEIGVKVWSKSYGPARDASQSDAGGTAKLFLLDAGEVTKYLYGPNLETMLKQQLVLGIGGVRLLRKLNIQPTVHHLNEGHTAMAILELARENNWDFVKVGQKIVATKHTIFTGAGLHLTRDQFRPSLELFIKKYGLDFDDLFSRGTHEKHPDVFATTNFLLKVAHKKSGVSHLHTVMEKTVHPNSELIPITNGINISHWDKIGNTADIDRLWQAHLRNKSDSINLINSVNSLSRDVLTIVWARRLVSYKRPDLLFSDITRLKRIVTNPKFPVKFVIAGKTLPTDETGAQLADKIETLIRQAGLEKNISFATDYSLPLAKKLVAQADVWLNTPIPGQEACGTSGMKAGLNGALMLSTNDGWMAEVNWDHLGWILPEENIAEKLYSTIEKEIAPMYYTNQTDWQQRALRTRSLILDYFNTKRVLEEYQAKLYV